MSEMTTLRNAALMIPIFVYGLAATAGTSASFKNFSGFREGEWETSTTVLEGPGQGKVVSDKRCVDRAISKKAVTNLLTASEEMSQCKTSVTEDTKDSAAFFQNCTYGPVTTKTTSQMKRLGPDTIETRSTVNAGGPVIRTVSTTHFIGACSAPKGAKSGRASTKSCDECHANVAAFKAKCATVTGPERATCDGLEKQIEGLCSMNCH